MLEKVRLGGLSGSYRLRKQPQQQIYRSSKSKSHRSEASVDLARDKKARIPVTVHFLDETAHVFPIDKRSKGSDLLEGVFRHLELLERDYFGLQFIQQHQVVGDVARWVDPNKQFKKQWQRHIRDGESNHTPAVQFKVKFFVNDPSRLQEEYTRYLFYLHLKRDIYQGKLQCTLNTACLLASYTVQSEIGDFNPVEHGDGLYLKDLQLMRDQNEENERRIMECHKLHRGQLPADAEYNYLEHAKRLEMYGIDLHSAMDSDRNELELGVSSNGLLVFQNHIRMNMFSWSKMVKLSFKRKDFFIQLRREMSENYDTLLGFNLKSHRNAKALWKSCVEHHSFFRLQRPHRSPRFLHLSLGSKFYYSGRTELQAVQESKQRMSKISKVFTRSPSKRLQSMRQHSPTLLNGTMSSDGTNSSSNGKQPQSSSNSKSIRPHDNKVTSKQSASMPRKAWEQQSDDDRNSPYIIEPCSRNYETPPPPPVHFNSNGSNGQQQPSLLFDSMENGQIVLNEEGLVNVHLVADEQGRFGFNVKGGADLKLPVLVSRVAPNTPAGTCSNPRISEGDQVVLINGKDISGMKHEQIVALIRASREYRGGELVLTIKPHALAEGVEEPLYLYVPEGDHRPQILDDGALFTQSLLLLSDGLASGTLLAQYEQMYRKNPDLAITEARKPENSSKNRYRDISPYDCTRVVLLNSPSGDYINANYVNMEIPGGKINRFIATQGPLENTTMDFWRMVQQESSHLVVMLTTSYERGRPKCFQYWPVPGDEMEMGDGFSVSCLTERADETGSFVYRDLILCDTKTDEKRSIQHLQYLAWPDHGVPSDSNLFLQFTEQVRSARTSKTLLEEIESSLKRVKLIDADDDTLMDISERKSAAEEIESPDDIPPSTSVHQCISAANPPIIVHCSAGIGRTGVLILMDTALELMEAKEPVYPLDIVKSMRDQRACMVQNVSQYRFVCECICSAYSQMVKEEEEEDNNTTSSSSSAPSSPKDRPEK